MAALAGLLQQAGGLARILGHAFLAAAIGGAERVTVLEAALVAGLLQRDGLGHRRGDGGLGEGSGRGHGRQDEREREGVAHGAPFLGRTFLPQFAGGVHVPRHTGKPQPEKKFRTTNPTLAGRSASRRMYHGNQYEP